MTILDFFNLIAPKTEQTVIRNKYTYKGFQFKNDLGACCDYRILTPEGQELGIIRYLRGRKLSCYER